MHDLDRTLRELESGIDALESGDFEFEEESDGGGMLGEVEEMEYAANLLEINDEQELDQFLGRLVGRAVSAGRGFVRSPTGQALVGVLKNAAGSALPNLGGVIGGAIGGDTGKMLGQQAGQFAKGRLGWELEGGGQDQEFETAQSLVRVATAAARQLANAPATGSPAAAATRAALTAARRVAPQLARVIASTTSQGGGMRGGQSGRWVRRGRVIILLGV